MMNLSALNSKLSLNWFNITVVVLVMVMSMLMLLAFWHQPVHNNELHRLAMANLSESGVTNPVTAVLLNYRAYDTFIEFAVFLCVAVAVLPYVLDVEINPEKLSSESQLLAIAKVFVPLSIVMAGYMLWIGSTKPGGAFQAASLLAGCLVLLSLANYNKINFARTDVRILLSAGLITFCLVAMLMLLQHGFLVLPPNTAGLMILVVEFFATFAISITLFLCFESIHKGHI